MILNSEYDDRIRKQLYGFIIELLQKKHYKLMPADSKWFNENIANINNFRILSFYYGYTMSIQITFFDIRDSKIYKHSLYFKKRKPK